MSAFVATEVSVEVQNRLVERAARQQDFALLMEAARQESYITGYKCAWEISNVLDNFRVIEYYGWKELMSTVDAVGGAIDAADAERE